MKYEQKDTLAYFNSAPQFKLVPLSDVSATDFAINCKAYKEGCGLKNPERSALEFYTLNHLAAIVKAKFTEHEKLPEWAQEVMTAYIDCMAEQGTRMLGYMVLITTRESRHMHKSEDKWTVMTNQFGLACTDFNKAIHGAGSGGAVDRFCTHPPKTTMGPYMNSLVYCFNKGTFAGGYGGKPWGVVAQTVASFIDGKTSLEMMVDTAYTLAHNNGPIFNKGMMYEGYNSMLLYRVLDVQRSGQMPELCLYDGICSGLVSSTVRKLVKSVVEYNPDAFGKYVDWIKVKDLGALHKYPGDEAAQIEKYGKPGGVGKTKTASGLNIVGKWAVSPNQEVQIFKRKKAA